MKRRTVKLPLTYERLVIRDDRSPEADIISFDDEVLVICDKILPVPRRVALIELVPVSDISFVDVELYICALIVLNPFI
jgi:D-ribose pyranose/furanose isomerase RbsD